MKTWTYKIIIHKYQNNTKIETFVSYVYTSYKQANEVFNHYIDTISEKLAYEDNLTTLYKLSLVDHSNHIRILHLSK